MKMALRNPCLVFAHDSTKCSWFKEKKLLLTILVFCNAISRISEISLISAFEKNYVFITYIN